MITVVVYHKSANDIINVVTDMVSSGLKLDVDFAFAFHPAVDQTDSKDAIPKHTVFTFSDGKHATLFSLKWG